MESLTEGGVFRRGGGNLSYDGLPTVLMKGVPRFHRIGGGSASGGGDIVSSSDRGYNTSR